MTLRRFLFAALLVDFLALTGWAIWKMGLMAIFALAVSSPGAILISVDLCVALTMACGFMWVDAKEQGINPVPFVLLTLGTGSAGPLAYMVRRG